MRLPSRLMTYWENRVGINRFARTVRIVWKRKCTVGYWNSFPKPVFSTGTLSIPE